jgi:1,2-phenylacetyl-CoA epoxidase PaaB subunit
MLHMQHPQLAFTRMQAGSEHQIQFSSEDPEHQRQLERVRDSLLRRPEARPVEARGA